MSRPGASPGPTLWLPLKHVSFRALWAAQMASNMAIWMHTVSVQWVLTSGGAGSTVVAAVQTAITLPFFLLALPAGVIADSGDRRRVQIIMQLTIAVFSLTLAVLTATAVVNLAGLLLATLGMGAASAISIVAWQSQIPELVERPLVPAAATLDGMSFNAGRIVGPAVGGLLLSFVDAQWIFGVNAIVFAAAGLTFGRWGSARRERTVRERLGQALSSGVRYVRHSPLQRRLLARVFLWTLPASLIWALLPVIAYDQLDLKSGGFGALFASLGVGAVVGGVALQPLRARMTPNAVLGWASLAYGAGFVVIAFVPVVAVVAVALAICGAAWITVLSTVMALAQVSLPPWVRARGLAIVLLTHQGCQALGSLLWGVVADLIGVRGALLIAGGILFGAGISVRWFGLRSTAGVDPVPVSMWTEPTALPAPDPSSGPLLVLVDYDVAPDRIEEFLAAMEPLGRSRRRIGARRWEIYQQGDRFVEAFVVSSWGEHVQQESVRWTRADKQIRDAVEALASEPPTVQRLIAASRTPPAGPRVPAQLAPAVALDQRD